MMAAARRAMGRERGELVLGDDAKHAAVRCGDGAEVVEKAVGEILKACRAAGFCGETENGGEALVAGRQLFGHGIQRGLQIFGGCGGRVAAFQREDVSARVMLVFSEISEGVDQENAAAGFGIVVWELRVFGPIESFVGVVNPRDHTVRSEQQLDLPRLSGRITSAVDHAVVSRFGEDQFPCGELRFGQPAFC